MSKYIAFYDDTCGLCNFSVRIFLSLDTHGKISYAPLNGETAKKLLATFRTQYPQVDSILFFESEDDDHPVLTFWSQAIFRCMYVVGGWWKLIGFLSLLPKWMLYPFDIIYRMIARRRRSFCPYIVNKEQFLSRFLP